MPSDYPDWGIQTALFLVKKLKENAEKLQNRSLDAFLKNLSKNGEK